MAKHVAIAASSNGDNTLVAAVTGQRIRVLGYVLSFSGVVNAKFTDGAAGTNLGGLIYGATNSVAQAPVVPSIMGASLGWFTGSTNTALILNLSAGVAVGGHLLYELVP